MSTRAPLRAADDARSRVVIRESRALLDRHARSFRVAALALGPAEADDAAVCYAFCRVADDAVDEAPGVEEGRAAIEALRDEARGRRAGRPLVAEWIRVALRRRIPLRAGWDLLDAIRTDLGPVRIEDDAALLRYAYGVAGTVGLMMCGVLGSRDPRAQAHAVDLGVAMQLTNIARDVGEDARRDRVYLPSRRLRGRGTDPAAVLEGRAPAATFAVVRELLDLAEGYYESARDGLRYLPLRGKIAVLLALHLYRGIGRAVGRRGEVALGDRTTLSPLSRALVALLALGELAHPRTWGILPVRAAPDHEALAGRPGARSPCTA